MLDKLMLLIEDNPDSKAFVSIIARMEGISLTTADSGEDGIAAYDRSGPFDLVLLDINLPGIPGWDVLQHIRGESSAPPPVLVFTALADNETRERAVSMGAAAVVQKPIGARELVEILRRYVQD